MKKGGVGGRLTKTGLRFKEIVDVSRAFNELESLNIVGNKILKKGDAIAEVHSKHNLYKFLGDKGISYEKILSKKLLPDIAVLVYSSKTFFIFEVKYQEVQGSTDEKLQTCHFKISQYRKLLQETLGYKVKYVYVLKDWFKDKRYNDVLDYIKSVEDCDYLFNKVPRKYLGI